VLPRLDAMISDGTPLATILIVIALLVAVVGEAQLELDTIPQVIASLLANEEAE
jgi:hypothetical protein